MVEGILGRLSPIHPDDQPDSEPGGKVRQIQYTFGSGEAGCRRRGPSQRRGSVRRRRFRGAPRGVRKQSARPRGHAACTHDRRPSGGFAMRRTTRFRPGRKPGTPFIWPVTSMAHRPRRPRHRARADHRLRSARSRHRSPRWHLSDERVKQEAAGEGTAITITPRANTPLRWTLRTPQAPAAGHKKEVPQRLRHLLI